MKKIRRLIVKMLLWALGTNSYHRIKKEKVTEMWNFMGSAPELRSLDAYFMQMSEDYRNLYMRTGDDIYKGMVITHVSLREYLLAHKPKRRIEGKLAEQKKVGENKRARAVKY